MNFFVFCTVRLLFKNLTTHPAAVTHRDLEEVSREIVVLLVAAQVLVEGARLVEGLFAVLTHVRLLLRVDADVAREGGLLAEGLVTVRAVVDEGRG